jgi:TPR repeat protein
VAPRACPDFDRCAAACEGPEGAASCYDAAGLALEGSRDGGRDLEVVNALLRQACARGDGRGCLRVNQVEDARRHLPRQCDEGNAEACELWAVVLEGEDAGVDAASRLSQAARLLEAECSRGEPFACARLGSARIAGRLGARDAKAGLSLLERACEAGVAGACAELALTFTRGLPPDVPPDARRAASFGKRARELSR